MLDLPVKIDDNLIASAKETVFFGVILDENLSWKPRILNVSRKMSKSIGIIYKASFCPPSTALVTIYYSLIYLYLIYCVRCGDLPISQTWNVFSYCYSISLLVFLWASLSLFTWLALSIVKHCVKPNGKKMNEWMKWMISALSLCPTSPSFHFLNNHRPSLFSWMDLTTNQSLCSVRSRGLVSRRKSLVPVYSDLFNTIWKQRPKNFKKRKNTGFLF